jgi:hypothetical protein
LDNIPKADKQIPQFPRSVNEKITVKAIRMVGIMVDNYPRAKP